MKKSDKLLGVDSHITRRDFVGSMLIGTGATLLGSSSPTEQFYKRTSKQYIDPWTGYGGVGDYASSNGNTRSVMLDSHKLRDGEKEGLLKTAKNTGEEFDLVIIGGGFSGLGAAYQFHAKSNGKKCLILDNHPIFGGEAKENEFEVEGHRLFGPQGSNGFAVPPGSVTLSDEIYRTVGMPMEYTFADEKNNFGISAPYDSYDAMYWGENKFDVGYFFGKDNNNKWIKNIWKDDLARTPWESELKKDMLRAFKGRETIHGKEGLGRWLDSMSYKTYLEEKLGLHPGVTKHLDPILAIANYGFGCDVISAYGAYLLALPGMQGYLNIDPTSSLSSQKILSFPGGNTTYLRHIIKYLIPDSIPGKSFEDITFNRINFKSLDSSSQSTRIRLSATGIDVRDLGDRVSIVYYQNGKAEKIFSKSVVMATPGFMSRNVVSGMPSSIENNYKRFKHGPALVVNVALKNWKFLDRLGFAAGRWYDGFGYFGSIRAPMNVGNQNIPYDPKMPIVMTFYVPFYYPGKTIDEQGTIGRGELLGKIYIDYEREIRTHMNDIFGAAGFDAKKDIAGIILNRWGHAYISPEPGFYFGEKDGRGLADPIKKGHGRIFYGHSELGSRMNYRNALAEGGRAGEQAAGIL